MSKTLTNLEPKSLAKTDFKKLSKKELVKMAEDFMLPLSDPKKYQELVRSAMPEFVKEVEGKEFLGTGILESGQEFTLAVVETLKKFNNFTDEDIKKFLKDLQGNMRVVSEIEAGGLSILSDHSMSQLVTMVKEVGVEKMLQKIAEIRAQKQRMWSSGLEHPRVLEGSNIEKQIQKPK